MRLLNKKPPPHCAHPRVQQGITLIELMIALVIGLLATGAMLKIYVDSSQLYRFNEGLARIQENGRLGLEFIRRDARMAGFWGCNHGTPPNHLYTMSSGEFLANPDGIYGEEEIIPNPPSGFYVIDRISFVGATGRAAIVTSDMGAANSPISVSDAETFSLEDLLLITDCETTDIFALTEITGTTPATLKHGSGMNATDKLSKAYAAGSRVYQITTTHFCIRRDANLGQSSLRRLVNGSYLNCTVDGDELVQGIEKMRILIGQDTDVDSEGNGGDGNANRYIRPNLHSPQVAPDGWIGYPAVSLRISLLAVSPNDNTTTEPAPYFFSGQEVMPSDKYLRKVFTTTVAIRNKTK